MLSKKAFFYGMVYFSIKLFCLGMVGMLLQELFLYAKSSSDTISLKGLYENTVHYQLENGMHIFLKKDPSSRTTAFHLRVNTGSIHEEQSYGSGLSHFFEHSLFLGSKKFPEQNSFSKYIEGLGGSYQNAYTTYNHTAYYYAILAENTLKGIEAMEDFIFNPLFREADVKNEMGSILAEMDMVNDNAKNYYNRFNNQFIFTNLPYKYPIIGYRERFEALSREDLLKYYYERYKPNNMILSLVGNFQFGEIIPVIEKTFGKHKKADINPIQFQPEQKWTTGRAEMKHPKSATIEAIWTWSNVDFYSENMYAIDLLASVLGGGKTSLLYRRLKEEMKLVQEVNCFSWTPVGGGVFEIYCSISPLRSAESIRERLLQIEKEILRIINTVADKKLNDKDIRVAHRNVLNAFIDDKDSAMDIAKGIASSIMSTKGINYDSVYMDGFLKVKKKDVVMAANRFLKGKPVKMTVMLPMGLIEGKLYEDSVVQDESFGKSEITVRHEEETKTIPGVITNLTSSKQIAGLIALEKKKTGAVQQAMTHKKMLSNGMTLLVHTDTKLPKVRVLLLGLGGLSYETEDVINGSFSLWMRMLLTSNKKFSKQKLYDYMAEHGIEVECDSGKNSYMISVSFLKDKKKEAAILLESILMNMNYHEGDFQDQKKEAVYDLKNALQNGWYMSGLTFNALFYKGTSYAKPSMGSLKAVEEMTIKEMRRMRQQFFIPQKMVFSLYGDITQKEVSKLFGWVEKMPSVTETSVAKSKDAFERVVYASSEGPHRSHIRGVRQAFCRIGYRAPKKEHEDSLVFEVMMAYFSGMGGPLFMMRSEPFQGSGGRAYSIGAYYDKNVHYGSAIFYAAFRYEAVQEYQWYIDGVNKAIRHLQEKPLADADLQRAKLVVLGQEIGHQESLDSKSLSESYNELYGYGYDDDVKNIGKIKNITAQQVQEVAKKYFSKDGFLVHMAYPEEMKTKDK